jgi:hypothetical protein
MLENPQNRFAVDLVSSAAHRHLIVRSLSHFQTGSNDI